MFEKTKLRRAIVNGDVVAAKAILAKKPALANMQLGDYSGRPLSIALAHGDRAMIDALHDNGAHVTERGDRGKNMLFDAVYHGRLDVLKAWAVKYSTIVHQKNYSGQTLLHVAAERGAADMVLWLLEDLKFNSELQDEYGRTALYYAEKHQRESVMAILKPLQEQALQKYKNKAARMIAPAAAKPLWRKLDDDRIAQVREDAAINYRLTEIFNFATLERTRLYRNLETNAETVESRSFAEIGLGSNTDIELARKALQAAGGKPPAQIQPPAQRLIAKKPHNDV